MQLVVGLIGGGTQYGLVCVKGGWKICMAEGLGGLGKSRNCL